MFSYIEFQKKRIAQTKQDIADFSRQHLWPSTIALIASLIALPVMQLIGADVSQEALPLVLESLLGPVFLVIAMALFFYIRAPAKIYKDQLSQIESLHGLTKKGKQDQFIANGLAVIRETGDIILRKRITEEELGIWDIKKNAWHRQALEFIANHLSYQDAIEFLHIQTLGKMRYVYMASEDHNRSLNHLSVSLEKIQSMLDQYREYWQPLTTEKRNQLSKEIFG